MKQNRQYNINSNTIKIIKNIWMQNKVFGFYVGYKDFFLREVCCTLIEFSLFEQFIRMSKRLQNLDKPIAKSKAFLAPEVLLGALLGGLAYGIAGFITTPFDVVKSRSMVNYASKLGTFEIIKHVWKEAGIRGLFRGCTTRTALTGAGGFIYYCVFFKVLTYMGCASTFFEHRKKKY
eukprot:TRINITY_DN12965_c0_g3_i2.p2 TRINITY_DN12965_c0_g3~~TRINITY_DN12965_c0_g3_i2.p2  ORF type:complete len:177 (+),score=51.83 TRINITY_DN12965_c0_g3_i2:590-1120(+)